MRTALVCLLIVTVSVSHAFEGSRLTSRDAGLYVGVAGDYMFGQVPFTFSIDQVGRKSDPVVLTTMIERLHANGKRSILDIFLYEDGNEQAKPAAEYMAWLDPLLSQLPLDQGLRDHAFGGEHLLERPRGAADGAVPAGQGEVPDAGGLPVVFARSRGAGVRCVAATPGGWVDH